MKNAYKKCKNGNFEKQKNVCFFLNPKIRFLDQKMCPVARERTDTQTHTKVNTEETLS